MEKVGTVLVLVTGELASVPRPPSLVTRQLELFSTAPITARRDNRNIMVPPHSIAYYFDAFPADEEV